MAAYVLSKFARGQEREDIDFAVQEAVQVLRSVLLLGVEKTSSGVRV